MRGCIHLGTPTANPTTALKIRQREALHNPWVGFSEPFGSPNCPASHAQMAWLGPVPPKRKPKRVHVGLFVKEGKMP